MMQVLVIGQGSIGRRHARLLQELACNVAVVSSYKTNAYPCFSSLPEAVTSWQPGYVVIANKTSMHHDTLETLAGLGYSGKVLVEKPLFHKVQEIPSNCFSGSFVGYNLRFHPIIHKVHELLRKEHVISVQAYVGQYLPTWRPQTDYRQSYSARKEEGGGALRDLSHELDYLTWMLGGWEQLTALGGHFSSLAIDSDDAWAVIMRTPQCPLVTVQLNYLDRTTRRGLLANTDKHTIEADLVKGTLMIDNDREDMETDRDFTYREQHLTILEDRRSSLCTLEQGMAVTRMIDAIERSTVLGKWIVK